MKFILAILASIGLASSASAADLTSATRAAAAAPASWQGFYLGIHGGYSYGEINSVSLEEVDKFDPKGFLVGGHAGYNWQAGIFVPGVEVDITWVGRTDTIGFADTDATAAGKIDYIGSARARLGVSPFENLLVYGTGGVGWAHSQAVLSNGKDSTSAAAVHFGWVAGAGAEFKLTRNFFLRGEYLHYDLGKASYSFDLTPINVNGALVVDVLRAGVSYRF